MKTLVSVLLEWARISLVLSSITFAVAETAAAAEAQPSDGSSVVLADALVGEWIAVVEGEKRTRTLIIENVASAAGPSIELAAIYGWSDGAQVKSATSLVIGPSSTSLRIFTPAKNTITATWVTADLFEGTFDLGTSVKKVSIRKREAGEDDKPTAARGIKKLTVLYVGAFNCPSCDDWKRRDQRAEAQLMASVELRQVQTNTYSYISQDSAWPEDLKPIRDRLKLKSGTPRFIIIADNRIVLHRFGRAAWQKDVLPKLAELTAPRPSAGK